MDSHDLWTDKIADQNKEKKINALKQMYFRTSLLNFYLESTYYFNIFIIKYGIFGVKIRRLQKNIQNRHFEKSPFAADREMH